MNGESGRAKGHDRRGQITELLAAVRDGQPGAVDQLMPLVYEELHLMAHRQLRRHRPGRTLNTTALVHEAYLQLVGSPRRSWNDRPHFLAVAATAMRHILIDYARTLDADKRGGRAVHTLLDGEQIGIDPRADELLMLDQALDRLGTLDQRLVKLVELRFFGGLTVEETAEVLEISTATVKREWSKARALLRQLFEESAAS